MFIVTPYDEEQIAACKDTDATIFSLVEPAGPGNYARKIQLGYDRTAEPFVFTGADDLDFQPGWDTAALDLIETGPYGVCGTNDLANPTVKAGRHSTHSLVRRAYVDGMGGTFDRKPGVLLHDGYDHQYVDTELVAAAIDRDQFVFCAGSHVRHRHPFFDRTVPQDDTYRKALAHGREDRLLYEARRRAWRRAEAA